MRFDTPYNQRTTPPHRDDGDATAHQDQRNPPAWNTWWSRRSPNIQANANPPARIGIDAGSKTLKLVALDADGQVVFAEYHRHKSDVRSSLAGLLHDVIWRHGDLELPVAVTGSAGIVLSEILGIPFVQEVVATTSAVRTRHPQADCVIELGGEDAKITYLSGNAEHRMNATCAGGTGDFIDGIAGMLGVRTRDMSNLALGAQRTYPIAARCAVFAQTDVRPLINAGASKADIAQSALNAVVRQTLGGLACGRPIRGNVVFLGGPLEHIPALVLAFRRELGLTPDTGIKPNDAHLYAAMGCVEVAGDAPAISLAKIERLLSGESASRCAASGPRRAAPDEDSTFAPLFATADERKEFFARHAREQVPVGQLANARGPLFLGLDAGSTSMKYVLCDEAGAIVASDYRAVEGDALSTAKTMLGELALAVEGGAYGSLPRRIARTVVTGYGEDMLVRAFGFDQGIVETIAHVRAARHFHPDVSFVLDIGGQDMKALWIRNGIVTDAVLNEACSSGCGAFLQSSAKSLRLSHEEFSRVALDAERPLDLGAKCTVFMTSRVRQAQKAGASAGDIAAGIAYSVVNNALARIIGKDRTMTLGDAVVVQGGTFKSDAVLRAFEKTSGIEAIRPSTAHLMGALGCALVARDVWAEQKARGIAAHRSALSTLDEIRQLKPRKSSRTCTGCANRCLLSVVDFGEAKRFVTGNRCERGLEAGGQNDIGRATARRSHEQNRCPNVIALQQKLIASFGDTAADGVRGDVRIGIMDALHAYASMPFWHTLVLELGFSVTVPHEDRSRETGAEAAETVPSESVCHPAKTTHERYALLRKQGADIVLMPRYERGSRCPVACLYADALSANVDGPRVSCPTLHSTKPEALAHRDDDADALFRETCSWAPAGHEPTRSEFDAALSCAVRRQRKFDETVSRATEVVRRWLAQDSARRVAVVASRLYQLDDALLNGVDRMLSHMGFAVVPASAWGKSQPGGSLWKPAKRLCSLVEELADAPQAEIVAVRSFGCGYDAVSFDEAQEAALRASRPFTELKMDDMADTAHIRIRLRTLDYASRSRLDPDKSSLMRATFENTLVRAYHRPARKGAVTADLCSTAKALVEQACNAVEKQPLLERLTVPDPCARCLTDALPFELAHIMGCQPAIERKQDASRMACSNTSARPVGLVGNPLLVFNPELNDHVEDLLHELGCNAVFPDLELVQTDDVRYLAQLQAFEDAGVRSVLYLQSFGCLKGHVQSRGALRELQRRFPKLSVTVLDYDPESSALNRENRIRLAVAEQAAPSR